MVLFVLFLVYYAIVYAINGQLIYAEMTVYITSLVLSTITYFSFVRSTHFYLIAMVNNRTILTGTTRIYMSYILLVILALNVLCYQYYMMYMPYGDTIIKRLQGDKDILLFSFSFYLKLINNPYFLLFAISILLLAVSSKVTRYLQRSTSAIELYWFFLLSLLFLLLISFSEMLSIYNIEAYNMRNNLRAAFATEIISFEHVRDGLKPSNTLYHSEAEASAPCRGGNGLQLYRG